MSVIRVDQFCNEYKINYDILDNLSSVNNKSESCFLREIYLIWSFVMIINQNVNKFAS